MMALVFHSVEPFCNSTALQIYSEKKMHQDWAGKFANKAKLAGDYVIAILKSTWRKIVTSGTWVAPMRHFWNVTSADIVGNTGRDSLIGKPAGILSSMKFFSLRRVGWCGATRLSKVTTMLVEIAKPSHRWTVGSNFSSDCSISLLRLSAVRQAR
jgi:hypothetical protein